MTDASACKRDGKGEEGRLFRWSISTSRCKPKRGHPTFKGITGSKIDRTVNTRLLLVLLVLLFFVVAESTCHPHGTLEIEVSRARRNGRSAVAARRANTLTSAWEGCAQRKRVLRENRDKKERKTGETNPGGVVPLEKTGAQQTSEREQGRTPKGLPRWNPYWVIRGGAAQKSKANGPPGVVRGFTHDP